MAVLITDEHLQLVAEGPVAWFHYTELPMATKGGPHIKKAITTLEAFLVVRVERFDALDRYIYIYLCLEIYVNMRVYIYIYIFITHFSRVPDLVDCLSCFCCSVR